MELEHVVSKDAVENSLVLIFNGIIIDFNFCFDPTFGARFENLIVQGPKDIEQLPSIVRAFTSNDM